MAEQHGSMYCPRCKAQVAAVRTSCNHVLHLLVSLLCVFWLPVWLLKAFTPAPWRCTRCGGVSQATRLQNATGRILSLCAAAMLGVVAWAGLASQDQTVHAVGIGAGLLAAAFVLAAIFRRA